MRALIAARKSNKVDGGEGQSLDTQDQRAREFCDRQGWEVVGAARDTISGRVAPLDRKDLGAWLADPSRFDVVVAFKSDRLSRGSDTDWSRIESWTANAGKTLCLVDSGTGIRYPARDDSDFWQWTAAKRQAGQEWENIRERIVRSHDALVASGSYVGRPPFGYQLVGPKYDKHLEVVEDSRVLIAAVFEQAIAGRSLRQIAAWLRETAGLDWHEVRVQRLINNWIYAGRVERKGIHYADCEPIVDAGTLVAAQRAMRSRTRKPSGGAPSDDPALLVLTCGGCSGRMYRGGKAPWYSYYCRGNPADAKDGCGFRVPLAMIDAKVMRKLTSSTEAEMAEKVIPAEDYADQIERLRRDRRAALERDDLEAVGQLTAEMKRLAELPAEPERTEPKPTGRTVGQVFAAMDREDVRTALKEWTIIAYPDPDEKLVVKRLVIRSPWFKRHN
ncbi:MAG TPA: recombinase family protein [Streptosporangiaceae bacterium]|nr:recombinase family protein [Streptosporangiaceae bacterium]